MVGSIVKLIDANGTEVFKASYDAWGNQTIMKNTIAFHRGYTGHEHLPEFGLINMNGRMYDPVLGRFLSPDPFVQAPDFSQNFNRYSYALNNPLKYTDPSGENPLLIAVFLGAFINTYMQGISGNIHNSGDFWKAAGIGALAGLAGFGAGSLVGGMLGTATTLGGSILNGAAVGAAGGFSGGFVGGAGNAWTNGANFGQGLKTGLISGGIGGASGAVLGGMTGGLQYNRQMTLFRRGLEKLDADNIYKLPVTDEFLSKVQEVWYPDAPMDKIDLFTVEHPSVEVLKAFNDESNGIVYGQTVAKSRGKFFSGKSDVFFNPKTFSSAKQLFFTMGHEFVHVSQIAYLGSINAPYSLANNQLFRDMMEAHAYDFQGSLVADGVKGTYMQSFSSTYRAQMMSVYSKYYTNLAPFNFSWTNNYFYIHPAFFRQ